VLCMGQSVSGLWGVRLCCVWDSLVWVLRSEFVLCVGKFERVCGERVCAVCGTVFCGFLGSECVLYEGQFGVGFWEISFCCV